MKKTASFVEKIIIGCGLPLSIVENPHFIETNSDEVLEKMGEDWSTGKTSSQNPRQNRSMFLVLSSGWVCQRETAIPDSPVPESH